MTCPLPPLLQVSLNVSAGALPASFAPLGTGGAFPPSGWPPSGPASPGARALAGCVAEALTREQPAGAPAAACGPCPPVQLGGSCRADPGVGAATLKSFHHVAELALILLTVFLKF